MNFVNEKLAMLKKLQVFTLLLIPLSSCVSYFPRVVESFDCQIERVLDGDTLDCDNGLRIRLFGIDAPEKSQNCFNGIPIGTLATEALRSFVLGQRVRVITKLTGRYGRLVAKVFVNNQDISAYMLSLGLAIPYKFSQYESIKEKISYNSALSRAMDSQKGMWQCDKVMSPYYFRKLKFD